MEVGGKLLTGAAATALLALVGHYATSASFVAELENSAQTELTAQGIDGVDVAFSRDPLRRSATLDGEVADDIKQKAMGAVQAILGVSSVRWKGDEEIANANSTDNGDPAVIDEETKQKIAKCQGDVDNSIEGKKLSFRSGSAYVSPASNKILDEVAAALKPCSDLAIAVGGHTDDNGDAGVNKILSQERADRVRQGLIDRDIAENLVSAIGYGSEQPLAKGGGADADAQNRRIEFKIQAKNSGGANAPQGE